MTTKNSDQSQLQLNHCPSYCK